jgi:aspartate dehydrogenase
MVAAMGRRTEMAGPRPQRVAIAGFGAIGKVVAARLDRGEIAGLALAAVSARDIARAERAMAGFARPVPVLPLARLGEAADIVVECAPAAVLREIAEPALAAGRTVIVLSCGALLDNCDLVDLARRHGGRILVPTGALLGLDAVQAAAQGEIVRVHMITRKPPGGLDGAPYLVERGIAVAGLDRPLRVFEGNAREAAKGFPANVNVAAALALAGIGPERTTIEIWADPGVSRNTHRIELEADSVRLSMQIENVPSAENPKTGRLTPLSVIALLKKLASPLAIGT